MLDERKMRILQAVVDDYITTAEPIGSRTIARKHMFGLSSATIRNEMADLEEMGYLSQLHTSSGRIPSDRGYRFYVDQLMKVNDLSREEMESIKSALEVKVSELSELVRQVSSIMSRITSYISMAKTPQMKKSALKAIQVVPIEPGKALIVVVTNAGVVRNGLVRISEKIQPDTLIKVSNIFNTKLSGLTIEQINLSVIKEIEGEIGPEKDIMMPILGGVADCVSQVDSAEIYLDGAANIFRHPEFRDVGRARDFLNILDEKQVIDKLLSTGSSGDGVTVRIGSENIIDEIRDCSLVTATYSLGDTIIGSIGVIGPTRMEYSKVISSMKYVREKIREELRKLVGEDLDNNPQTG